MALRSRVSEMLGIKYPILLAGMGGASVPRLAAAVSNAGGLGVLGAAACSPEQLREWIRETRSLTDKPFGVDTLLPASVRRGTKPQSGGGDLDPMEVLGEYKKFARDFLSRPEPPRLSPMPVRKGKTRAGRTRRSSSPRSSLKPRWRSWSRKRSLCMQLDLVIPALGSIACMPMAPR